MRTPPPIVFVVVLSGVLWTPCSGTEVPSKIISGSGCPQGGDFEKQGYVVRGSRVDDPFSFLRWVVGKKRSATTAISEMIDNKPFRYATAVAGALKAIEDEQFLPDSNDRVRVSLEFVTVENCANGQLDLVYRVYSSQILPVLSGTPEQRAVEKKAPQNTVGLGSAGSSFRLLTRPADEGPPVKQTDTTVAGGRLADDARAAQAGDNDKPVGRGTIQKDSSPGNSFHLVPTIGYDNSDNLFAGGSFQMTLQKRAILVNAFNIEGYGSSTLRYLTASLSGSADSKGCLAHAAWSVNYLSSLAPLNLGQQSKNFLSGQFSGTTNAFAGGNMIARFGGSVEGGNLHSPFGPAELAKDTVSNASYGAIKFFLGVDSRLQYNIISASYGLELGSVGPSASVGWIKQVGDVSYEFWHPVGAHRILDIESHITAGGLSVPGSIPAAARFFGGSREQLFNSGTDWQIRSSPVIRAIPGILFYRTAAGAGANTFFSYDLTTAYTVWYRSVIPSVLANDRDFQELLDAQITSATSIEQNYYATKDSHYSALVARLPAVKDALARLLDAVKAAQSATPGTSVAEFKKCIGAISLANVRTTSAINSKNLQQYGLISALLSVDPTEHRLATVVQACVSGLNGVLQDSRIETAGKDLDAIRVSMEDDFATIDQRVAKDKAAADMVFIRRTLHTLFHDLNIYSISPVAIFDIAEIGPEARNLGGSRIGPGGGIRFELASSVNFTAGYAWNVNGHPGEGPGAVFFSLGVRDLFH